MLTDKDLKRINQVRDIMAQLESDCFGMRRTTPESYTEADGFDYGVVASCASRAGDSLFDLLNVMSSYRVQKIAPDVMHNRKSEEVEV